MWITISSVICQLAVPSFFFISGYFFFSKFNISQWDWKIFFEKIKKRLKTLLLPYLLWNMLYLLPSFGLYGLGRLSWHDFSENLTWHIFWDIYSSPTTNILGVMRFGTVPLDGPLWFIRDLMFCCLFSPLAFFLIRRFKISILFWGGILYVFDIWIPFTGFSKCFVLFCAGAYFMLNGINPITTFCNVMNKKIIFAQLVIIIAAILCYGNNDLLFSIFKCLFSVVAIPTLFMLVSNLLKKGKINTNKKWESCGFFVFAMHYFIVLSVFPHFFTRILPNIISITPLFCYFMIAILSYVVCIIMKIFIDRYFTKLGYILNGCR